MRGSSARCFMATAILLAPSTVSPAETQEPLSREACEIEGVKGEVTCGTYQIAEDRASPMGRKIGIGFVVLHATSETSAPDPLVYIPGGPGQSATEMAVYLADEYAQIREHRDILLVDQRGTGGSNPLNCDLFGPPEDPQSYLGRFFPLEDVRTCRTQLETRADLKLYTTPVAMDDLDEVRAALGYEQLNLIGGSYGTRAVQVYMKRHGEHVRTAVLMGVTTTSAFLPRDFAPDAQRALDGVVEECLTDDECARAFPKLRDEVTAVFAGLEEGPVTADVVNPLTGDIVEVLISRDIVAEAVRYLLYGSVDAGKVPVYIHHAALGDFTPIAEYALFARRRIVAAGSNGMYLSVTCAEDLPWIEPGAGERSAEGTFLGDYRVRDQRAACDLWPRGDVPSGFGEPVHSAVPTLLLSGQWDPVTPPRHADAAAEYLENALRVVVPHGGHGFNGLEGVECVDRLVHETIERGTVEGMDTGCIAHIRRPPFPVSLPPMRPIVTSDEDLQAFTGRYAVEGNGLQLIVEVAEGKLKLDMPDSRVLFAVAVGDYRFRVAGASEVQLIFVSDGSRVTALDVEQDGVVTVRLMRLNPEP